jgi:hypothetical protein
VKKQLETQIVELINHLGLGSVSMAKEGLYSNIQKKKARIEAGSGEKMRKPGTKGAPTKEAFKESAKTAKK